ncbi:hypothetical protein [Verrucomicrobium sp. BvORR034]|uniref:ATP-dependent DNA ligase n=1 Tax=Verrucomicrobium sp. BvORR034 TaxID=1396418 RepID=UPI0006798927|nr:hypothetical protein [Verrucomicrobium sp. BvORR034]
METTTLYCQQGPSDKVYSVSLKPEGDGHVVLFAYGRRNATLNTGRKTPHPVPYDQAKACYDGLVREKLAKGYQHGEPGTDYQPSRPGKPFTGILPQLLNPVDADDLSGLLDHPAFWMQEKHDGRRLLLRRRSDLVTGINRLGLETSVPMPMVEAARRSVHDFVVDGEAVGNCLCTFDLLELDGEDLRGLPYGQRYLKLIQVLAPLKTANLHFVQTAFLPHEKHRMLEELRQQGREGVVFKSCDAPHSAGRLSSGGPQLKHKFYETASFIVGRINEQRSVGLLLFEGDRIRPAGNVTIPPNHDLPLSGQVVECRYLYAFRESGAIYQPVFLGIREDVLSAECLTGQLKYKSEPLGQAA